MRGPAGERLSMKIVAIAPNKWNGHWMNRQHLTWAMKDHVPVLYVQEPDGWHKGLRRGDQSWWFRESHVESDSLRVLRLPRRLASRMQDGRWNRWVYATKSRLIREHLDPWDGPVVLYLWHPQLWGYVESLEPDCVVYHLYDMLRQFHAPEYRGSYTRRAFDRMCARADVVIAGTPLQASKMPADSVRILPNAVPMEAYERPRAEPRELKGIPHPRIGYVGSVTKKVDLGWLRALAEVGSYRVVIVGRSIPADAQHRQEFESLVSRPNVHYLGPQPPRSVPAFMQHLDVGLMNYRRGLHCELSSPLKLYEYCAAGLPIVGSRLPSLTASRDASNFAILVDTAAEAVQAVGECLQLARRPEEAERRRDFARRNSWDRRARDVVGWIEEALQQKKAECR